MEKILETGNRYRAIVDQMRNSPVAKALADYANSPAAKRVAEYAASPQAQNFIKNLERIEKQTYYLTPPKR